MNKNLKTILLDTNLLIRFFSRDDAKKSEAVRQLLKKAESGLFLCLITLPILAEVTYVLNSKKLYNFSKSDISHWLTVFLNLPGIVCDGSLELWEEALDVFCKNNIDFEDAYLVALANQKNITEIYSYDKDFDQFKDLKRMEP